MAKNNQKPPPKFPDIRSPWVIFFIFLIFIVLLFVGRVFPSMEEITWKDFEGKMLSRNAVDKIVVVNKETVKVYIKKELVKDSTFSKVLESPFSNEGINTGPHYTFNIGSIESFEKKMDEAQNNVPSPQRINVSYEESSHFNDVLSWLIPLIVVFLGADIANICNEAALIAARRKKENREVIFKEDVEKILGPRGKNITKLALAGNV